MASIPDVIPYFNFNNYGIAKTEHDERIVIDDVGNIVIPIQPVVIAAYIDFGEYYFRDYTIDYKITLCVTVTIDGSSHDYTFENYDYLSSGFNRITKYTDFGHIDVESYTYDYVPDLSGEFVFFREHMCVRIHVDVLNIKSLSASIRIGSKEVEPEPEYPYFIDAIAVRWNRNLSNRPDEARDDYWNTSNFIYIQPKISSYCYRCGDTDSVFLCSLTFDKDTMSISNIIGADSETIEHCRGGVSPDPDHYIVLSPKVLCNGAVRVWHDSADYPDYVFSQRKTRVHKDDNPTEKALGMIESEVKSNFIVAQNGKKYFRNPNNDSKTGLVVKPVVPFKTVDGETIWALEDLSYKGNMGVTPIFDRYYNSEYEAQNSDAIPPSRQGGAEWGGRWRYYDGSSVNFVANGYDLTNGSVTCYGPRGNVLSGGSAGTTCKCVSLETFSERARANIERHESVGTPDSAWCALSESALYKVENTCVDDDGNITATCVRYVPNPCEDPPNKYFEFDVMPIIDGKYLYPYHFYGGGYGFDVKWVRYAIGHPFAWTSYSCNGPVDTIYTDSIELDKIDVYYEYNAGSTGLSPLAKGNGLFMIQTSDGEEYYVEDELNYSNTGATE